MTMLYWLIPLFIFVLYQVSWAQNPLKYKYTFRNTILSQSKKYELAPVLRGRVYYPRYFYIPSLKQYLVYSDLDETGDFKVYETKRKPEGKTYAILDENGTKLLTFETPLRFSYRSGCFYGPSTYIPFFETGQTGTLPYDKIHNAELNLNKNDFEKLFQELYITSEYIEFINLRASNDNDHQAGVIFKHQGKVEILLSALHDSRMSRHFQENDATNNNDDYYLPEIRNRDNFPQSSPAIEMVPLETKDSDETYWRTGLNKTFQIKKYSREYSSGWQGIMKIGGIPIYVPGEGSGTAYVNFETKGDIFKIKILDVEKADYVPNYNLGLRAFELPANLKTEHSLIFMESGQNAGDNRLGGGVFVVRPATTDNPSADIPSDMTEEHFNTLPLTLQVALLDPDGATSLKMGARNMNEWIPEIERLKNLTHLEMSTGMTEIPDEIARFPKLQTLVVTYGKIQKVSPKIVELKELKDLDLFSNNLTEFPRVLLELKQLERLKIGGNGIQSIPDDINRLENLEYLSITATSITSLPESMINMKKLYVDESNSLMNKLPVEYKHLFDYTKLKSDY